MNESYKITEIENYCNCIDKLVLKGVEILNFATKKLKDGNLELPCLLLLRQAIDSADGISILIKNQSNDAAVSVIRTLFEIQVSLEYLLEKDYYNRAAKFLFYHNMMKIRAFKKLQKGTPEHKEFMSILEKDIHVSEELLNSLKKSEEINGLVKDLEQTLNHKFFEKINNFYKDNPKKLENVKNWFSLVDGPSSLYRLLLEIGSISRYEIQYKDWSSLAHGWDVINRNLFYVEPELAQVVSIRNPTGSYKNFAETVSLLRRTLIIFLIKKMPDVRKREQLWFSSFDADFDKINKSREAN